jgi:integrating conjugative element protein (TIGR03765 family)
MRTFKPLCTPMILVIALGLTLVAQVIAAPPEVIFDSGQTVMIRDWARLPEAPPVSSLPTRSLQMTHSQEVRSTPPGVATAAQRPSPETAPGLTQAGRNNYAQAVVGKPLLPYSTPGLSPGHATPRKARFDLPRPVCVLGADPASLQWVEAMRESLIQMNAICWLVAAESLGDLKRVNAATPGLSVLPFKGEVLVQKFGLTHYPALITQEGIE